MAEFVDRWLRDYRRPRETTNRTNAAKLKAFRRDFARRRLDDIAGGPGLGARAPFGARRGSGDVHGCGQRRPGPLQPVRRPAAARLAGPEGPRGDDRARGASPSGHGAAREPARADDQGHDHVRGLLRRPAGGAVRARIRRRRPARARGPRPPPGGLARRDRPPEERQDQEDRLPPPARDALVAMPRRAGAEIVFTTPTGRGFTQTSWTYHWHPVRAAAGRPGMDFL